jgi:hypothetical protein
VVGIMNKIQPMDILVINDVSKIALSWTSNLLYFRFTQTAPPLDLAFFQKFYLETVSRVHCVREPDSPFSPMFSFGDWFVEDKAALALKDYCGPFSCTMVNNCNRSQDLAITMRTAVTSQGWQELH